MNIIQKQDDGWSLIKKYGIRDPVEPLRISIKRQGVGSLPNYANKVLEKQKKLPKIYTKVISKLKKCNACKETILGKTNKNGNDIYHEFCFICRQCRNRVEEGESIVLIHNKVCHTDCVKDLRICDICNEDIIGKGIFLRGKYYHKTCTIKQVKQCKEELTKNGDQLAPSLSKSKVQLKIDQEKKKLESKELERTNPERIKDKKNKHVENEHLINQSVEHNYLKMERKERHKDKSIENERKESETLEYEPLKCESYENDLDQNDRLHLENKCFESESLSSESHNNECIENEKLKNEHLYVQNELLKNESLESESPSGERHENEYLENLNLKNELLHIENEHLKSESLENESYKKERNERLQKDCLEIEIIGEEHRGKEYFEIECSEKDKIYDHAKPISDEQLAIDDPSSIDMSSMNSKRFSTVIHPFEPVDSLQIKLSAGDTMTELQKYDDGLGNYVSILTPNDVDSYSRCMKKQKSKYCSSCQTHNLSFALFCCSCGHKLIN